MEQNQHLDLQQHRRSNTEHVLSCVTQKYWNKATVSNDRGEKEQKASTDTVQWWIKQNVLPHSWQLLLAVSELLVTYALGVLILTLCHGSLRLKKYIITSSEFVKNESKKGTRPNNNITIKNIRLIQNKFNPIAFWGFLLVFFCMDFCKPGLQVKVAAELVCTTFENYVFNWI